MKNGKPSTPRVRLYTRPGCGLCDELKSSLAPFVSAGRLQLEEVDLSGRPELEARYGNSIPVLEHEGRAFAKGRIDATEAVARLERRLAP